MEEDENTNALLEQDEERDELKDLKSALGTRLRNEFSEVAAERELYEQEWLKDLRQYKGVYEPDVLTKIHPKRSKAYIRLTRTKVRTMDAKAADMLFPANGERNWDIEPTPEPEIPPMKRTQLVEAVRQITLEQQGVAEEPTDDQIEIMVDELADKACDRMRTKIDDQLVEGKYAEKMRDVMHSGHLFGTGVLKGPMTDKRLKKQWKEGEGGAGFELQETEELTPYFEFVPIWDVYPDMGATTLDECDFVFQRHVFTKHNMRSLAKRASFNGDAIRAYMREHPQGDATYLNHETELRAINGKLDTVRTDRNRKYEVLEFWGYVDGTDLAECGCDIDDDELDMEFEANVWIVGDIVIKAVLNPTDQQQRPYHFYYFEKDETSIFGTGVPAVLRDTQTLYNSAIRAALDNGAISAGPQIEVNLDLCDDPDPTDVYPFKVWLRTGAGQEAMAPALRVYTLPSYVKELMGLADTFKQLADETSTIPSYMHGEADKGVGRTVGGLSMLMGAANITIKDVARNCDNGVTKPFIGAMYHWNMQFSDDDRIKGDFKTVPKGSTSLVAKEMRAQQLLSLAGATANPVDAEWTKRGEMWRQIEQAHDLDGIIKSDQEHEDDMREKAAQAQAQGGAPGGAPVAPVPGGPVEAMPA